MEVTLLAHTPEAEAIIYASMRSCYSKNDAIDHFQEALADDFHPLPADEKDKIPAFIRSVLASGHVSPIEHVSFTFAISGVSRALTHQLVRHRIASYSQQSQRYVDAQKFEFVTPPSIKAIEKANVHFQTAMSLLAGVYEILIQKGIKPEDARFVLPNAATSKIVVTMNCRTLLNFFAERCCMRAQWEIRAMANQMLALCVGALPVVFDGAGAKCEKTKLCPEGKRSCGRYPACQS